MSGWWNQGDQPPIAAVAIRLIDHPATHVGLAYQVDDEGTQLKLLHLAFHNDLRNDPLNISTESRYFLLIPHLHPTRLEFLATRCRQVAKRRPDLPYGFRLQRDAIFNDQGEYLVKDDRGLTCSSFVIVLCRSAQIHLVNEATWVPRQVDVKRHESLLQFLQGVASPEWVRKIAEDVRTIRVRPEETAGACLSNTLPVSFAEAESLGKQVLERLTAASNG